MRHPYRPNFSRRRVLQALGVGAAVSPFVPLLESGAAGSEAPPKRLVLFFSPHGTVRERWLPTGTVTDFVLPQILEPLAPFQDRTLVIDGLRIAVAGPPGGPHTVGPAYLFTGSPMLEGSEFNHPCCGMHGWASHASIDQSVAAAIGNETPFRSLEFGVQPGGSHPGSRISYLDANQPLAPESDPFSMFDRLFGDQGIDPAVAARRKAQRLGVIDVVKPELDALTSKVSPSDRVKIDAHLTAIAQMESQFNATYTCAPPDLGAPAGLNDFAMTDAISKQQLDLMVEAFACGVTNVASVMYRRGENDGFPYPFLGIDTEHHGMSHEGDSNLVAVDSLSAIYRWYAEQLAYLAAKMDAVIEPDGSTLLDNTMIVWGSEIAKGNTHSWENMPFVVVGGGGGALRTGRFHTFAGQNHNRLLVTIAQAFGIDIQSYGGFDDGSGGLSDLLA
ncbi:MAG: DUF1552 domain-containing protein [Deltaproteobacteria bacterium]|nr:DUF1552 domain-containing protein [Nannocystaceae bacterium]